MTQITPVSVGNLQSYLPTLLGNTGGMLNNSGTAMISAINIEPDQWTGGEISVPIQHINADDTSQLVYVIPSPESMDTCEKKGVKCLRQEDGALVFSAIIAPATPVTLYAIINNFGIPSAEETTPSVEETNPPQV